MLLALLLAAPEAFASQSVGIALASQVREVRGAVTILRKHEKIAASQAEPLYAGDELRVPAGGTMVVWLHSGVTLKLAENTVVRLAENTTERSLLRLMDGGLFTQLDKRPENESARKPRLSVQAGRVTLGAKGTEFFASWDRPASQAKRDLWLYVREGAVGVEPKKLEVGAGLGVKIREGSQPGRVARFRWTERLNWSLDPAQGDIFSPAPRWEE